MYASVQVARIVAVTVVLCSVILGFFLLASAYVTANASCKQLEQEIELLGEMADRFQPPLQPEALVQVRFSQLRAAQKILRKICTKQTGWKKNLIFFLTNEI